MQQYYIRSRAELSLKPKNDILMKLKETKLSPKSAFIKRTNEFFQANGKNLDVDLNSFKN